MFGITVIRKSELQKLRLSEKAMQAQSEQIKNERNEYKMKCELLQAELNTWKPQRGKKGKFVKKNQ